MSDDRPSIAELQRLCRDEDANHDAELADAAPALLEIAAAALTWQRAVRERCGFGTTTYASNPFDVMTEDFKVEAERLDAAADGLLSVFLAALGKVAP